MKPLFCNRCHKRIMPPSFLSSNKNINITGKITVKCGDAKCKGECVIRPSKEKERTEISVSAPSVKEKIHSINT